MRAGSLNTPLSIQSRDSGEDAAGQPVLTWTEVAQDWGDIRSESGLATIRNGVAADVAGHSIRVRYTTSYNAGMRAVDLSTGDIYDIKHVIPDKQKRKHTDLVCELGGNDG